MRLRLLDPFGLHLSEEKNIYISPLSQHCMESTELWPILHSVFLTCPSYMLLEMVAEGFSPLPASDSFWPLDICNSNKKKRGKKEKEVYNYVVQTEVVEGGRKIQCALIQKPRWLSSAGKKKSNVSQFVNFGTARPLEIQQYTEFTSKSSTCKWPGTVSPLD